MTPEGKTMSADVSIGKESFNYTHNLAKLWYDHIPDHGKGGGLREIDGVTGKAAFEILRECIDNIDSTRHKYWDKGTIGEPEFCSKYDAKNGWGSAIGGILFLAQIMAACAANPRHRVYVSL